MKYKIMQENECGVTVFCAYNENNRYISGTLSHQSAEDCEQKLKAQVENKRPVLIKEVEL